MAKHKKSVAGIFNDISILHKQAKQYIFSNIKYDQWKRKTDRLGDLTTKLDGKVSDIYKKYSDDNHIMMYSEESSNNGDNLDLNNFDYLLIIDSIDGTVNMLSNLMFGVNIALIPINANFRNICIKDIEMVFVTDYRSDKSYQWKKGERTKILHPKYNSKTFKKCIKDISKVFEIPDEYSYTKNKEGTLTQIPTLT